MELAIQNIVSSIYMIETDNYKEAHEYIDKVLNRAIEPFQYLVKNGMDIESFWKSIIAMKLVILSNIAMFSYNENNSRFLPFNSKRKA